jgi:hypothetical protein
MNVATDPSYGLGEAPPGTRPKNGKRAVSGAPAGRPPRRAVLVHGSRLPMPPRRTFAVPILAILFGTAVAVSSFVNRARPSRPAVRPRAALVRGSGLPVPHRRTFASGIVPAAHCMSAALRHPGYACSHSPAPGHGQPLADFVPEWRSGEPHVPIRPWLRRRVLLS